MIAVIDADAISYIVVRNEFNVERDVFKHCESMLGFILSLSKATHYLGAFSGNNCFRNTIYKVRKYKGNRPPKPDYIQEWAPRIEKYFMDKWGFVKIDGLEADDVVCHAATRLDNTIICSPDKDLRQVPGTFFNYNNKGVEDDIQIIDAEQALLNLMAQYLSGDSTDNIVGIPKIGAIKARLVLKGCADEIEMMEVVCSKFVDYYGPHYGPIIMDETIQAVEMLNPKHPQWNNYKDQLIGLGSQPVPKLNLQDAFRIDDVFT